MVGFFGQKPLALLKACRINGKDNRKYGSNLNPQLSGVANQLSIVGENALRRRHVGWSFEGFG
jgi:hypothetical protein